MLYQASDEIHPLERVGALFVRPSDLGNTPSMRRRRIEDSGQALCTHENDGVRFQ